MDAETTDIKFIRAKSNPFLSPQTGTFYADGATTADVLDFKKECLLFFGGLSNKHERIGLATVKKDTFDGTTWNRPLSNPIVDIGGSGDFDSFHVTDPASVAVNDKIHLYYSGLGEGEDAIGLALSDNGRKFEKSSVNPVLAGRAPEIVRHNGRFYLFFVKTNLNGGYSVYLNTSDDGIHFSATDSKIALAPKPDAWDSYSITTPRICKKDDTFMMIYAGDSQTKDQPRSFGLAVSKNLESWSRFGNNPVFSCGKAGSWDDKAIWFGTPYIYRARVLMLYEGCQQTLGCDEPLSQIGIAELITEYPS